MSAWDVYLRELDMRARQRALITRRHSGSVSKPLAPGVWFRSSSCVCSVYVSRFRCLMYLSWCALLGRRVIIGASCLGRAACGAAAGVMRAAGVYRVSPCRVSIEARREPAVPCRAGADPVAVPLPQVPCPVVTRAGCCRSHARVCSKVRVIHTYSIDVHFEPTSYHVIRSRTTVLLLAKPATRDKPKPKADQTNGRRARG